MTTMRIVLILYYLAACLATVLCGSHPDGVSEVHREQDALGNYKFSYAVNNHEGEHFRKEGTDHLGRVIGSYGLTHVDGTQRVVDYVADKDGFRAEVRSNEPGVASAESADASIVKLHPNSPLTVAATSIENSGAVFGARLKTDSSRVSYADTEEKRSPQKERLDNSAKESRQRTYEDYRPRNPVAYYPSSGSADGAVRPLNPPPYRSADVPPRSVPSNPSDESRPSDVYFPPIDPHTAIRRPQPPYYIPRDRTTDRSLYTTTTSRRPFTPPYGGFDDDPPLINRRPGISMSTIHGGLGHEDLHTPRTSTPDYGAGRYPSGDSPFSRDIIRPHFPPSSNFPSLSQHPGSLFPPPSRNVFRGPFFSPPSYDRGQGSPNFVLRAVPIPNGIQAVRVDPETGRIYERLMYPLFLRQDGNPVYDRRILLQNDGVTDDDAIRNDNPGYLDIPFRRRPPFRSVRNQPFDFEDFNRTGLFNRSYVFDPRTLSIPTARDLTWVRRQMAMIEGYDRPRFSNPSYTRGAPVANSEFPLFDDFDDSPEDSQGEDGPYSHVRNIDEVFPRNPRLIDSLTPEDTKNVIVSESKNTESDPKPAETDPKPSMVEKE